MQAWPTRSKYLNATRPRADVLQCAPDEPRAAGVEAKQKHLDALQQSADTQVGQDAKAKQAFVAKLVPALMAMLAAVPPQSQPNAGQALRAAAIQMLRKVAVPQAGYALPELCETVFQCCVEVIEQDNQDNAGPCCSMVGTLIRFRRHYPPQSTSAVAAEKMAATLVDLLLAVRRPAHLCPLRHSQTQGPH